MRKPKTTLARTRGVSSSALGEDRSQGLPDNWRLSSNVAHYLSRVLNRLNLDLADRLREFDITGQHFRVLQILYSGDGITIGGLSQRCVVTLPVLSRVLNQMQERGLVERRPNPDDARYTHIFMTPRGVEIYEATWPMAQRIIERSLEAISPGQVDDLLGLIKQVDRRINE